MTDNFSITIKNFKSYKEATLPLASLTLLIGANASGKSNAIEAFRFLSWVAGGERLSTLKNRVNDSDKIIRGTINDLVFLGENNFSLGLNISKQIRFETVFVERKSNLEILIEFYAFQNKNYLFYREKPNEMEHIFEIYASKLNGIENLLLDKKQWQEAVDDESLIQFNDSQLSILAANPEYNLILKELSWRENSKAPMEFFKKINKELIDCYFYDFVPSLMRSESSTKELLNQNGQNLAGVLHYLCEKSKNASENKTKLLDLIKSLPEQNIIDIKFYVDHRDRVEFALIEDFGSTPKEFPMDLLSDGTLKVLAIATALLSVPIGSTLVIEEIDNSIHPSRAYDILSLMRQYAEERGLKLLLSTHNPALMDAIPDEALADVVFCYRDPRQGDSRLLRLGDLDDYVGLVVQGSLGDLVTRGIVERFVKHPKTKEEKKKQALDWLNQMQVDSQ